MKIKRIWQRYMTRPLIYMTATRLMAGLVFLLALDRLVPGSPAPAMTAGFLTVLFALFSYLVYLRMDGMGIPRVKHLHPKKSKDPLRSFGSMSDHADDEPGVTFDDLEPEEKDLCSFLASLLCTIVFLALSFLL